MCVCVCLDAGTRARKTFTHKIVAAVGPCGAAAAAAVASAPARTTGDRTKAPNRTAESFGVFNVNI